MTTPRPPSPGSRLSLALLLAALSPAPAAAEPPGPVLVATYRGIGGQLAAAVGPGREPGSERLYAGYLYNDDTFEVTSIDPATGAYEVLRNPVPGEFGVRSMLLGPDGNVYLGTLPKAHLQRVETRTGRIVDLGRPAPGEEMIWDLALGADGKLYGGTSPSARLVRYDPRAGKLEDLGRMHPTEQYLRYVAASADGWVYAGVGSTRMDIVAYRISSGEHRLILPADRPQPGFAEVWAGADGKAFALAGKQVYRLDGWTAAPIDGKDAAPRSRPLRTKDGRSLALRSGALEAKGPAGSSAALSYAYAGRDQQVFRLGLGPDGRVYGSTMLPARLVRLDEERGRFDDLGELGGGEVYSFLGLGKQLLMAGYAVGAPLLRYAPGEPFAPGASPNPARVHYPGADESWRPLAMVAGPGGKAWIGAIPGYGKTGGPLVAWDAERGQVEERVPVPDQSLSALAVWKERLVGGTAVKGGSGAKATAAAAKVFVWEPAAGKVLFDLEPVPGAPIVDNLAVVGDVLWGIAGSTYFSVDLGTRQVKVRRPLPFLGGTVFGALAAGPDGRLWGLAGGPKGGVFALDPASGEASLVVKMPRPITGGFATRGRYIYFACGAEVYRYHLPEAQGARRK